MDLDRMTFFVECPKCEFTIRILYRDARLRDVLICRGCKANVRLDDSMNQCRNARRQFNNAIRELEDAVSKLNKTFKIRL
jgi:hypothetical protein